RLLARKDVSLTLIVNGYDDGASTGAVRRFLGDSLGPSDFRKNASRVASATSTATPALVDLLDRRLPVEPAAARAAFDAIVADGGASAGLNPADAAGVRQRLEAFLAVPGAHDFPFTDCAVGNLVFAGSYLLRGRRFNAAVDDYCGLLGLPPGVIDNVTNGENAHLVAIDRQGIVLSTEETIVDARRQNSIDEIFLIDRPLPGGAWTAERARDFFHEHAAHITLNERAAARVDAADLIVYAP